jgi:hypothetical protein
MKFINCNKCGICLPYIVGNINELFADFFIQKQAELIDGSLPGLCLNQNTPDEIFGPRQSVYHMAKGP